MRTALKVRVSLFGHLEDTYVLTDRTSENG